MTFIILVFIFGYLAIAFENTIRVNKAATALMTGVICWTVYIFLADSKSRVITELTGHVGELSQILFFLLGAMTIVELIDLHDGFENITQRIKTTDKRKLLWIVGFLSFFLSAILDNLTTAIVMVSLIRKLMADEKDRMMMAGLIIICSNAGGAWSPIGDVTTTMLWIGGQITTYNIIIKLLLPSLACSLVSLLLIRIFVKGRFQSPNEKFGGIEIRPVDSLHRKIVFLTGIGILLLVPVFKTVTHLPPFMGMLIGLGIIWLITEIVHSDKDEQERKRFTVSYAIRKIDTPSILFFLGILLAVAALESTGQLVKLATWLDKHLKDQNAIAISMGLASSIVDNVPLVAASMGMYDLNRFPTDHYFWEFIAYSTGTGGSALIIGSAAGVAVMGIERINFVWYLKRISWIALAGFFAGAIVYILQRSLFFL
ncbi:MAG TPA: sodium:proton antiporter NhaD [Chitinophagaceae bacterium]|nr:sodium:proton antiporter NhaD [Chitinophagaceae bacterium]